MSAFPSITGIRTHGNTGLILKQATTQTQKDGLTTGTAVFTHPMRGADTAGPMIDSSHPMVSWLRCEKRNVTWGPGIAVIKCDFAGLDPNGPDDTPPVYELQFGTGQEPIEIHPKFASELGGKPSSPQNGAIYVDPQGNFTTDDQVGMFERFAIDSDLAGITHFLDTVNITWRMKYTARSKPSGMGNVGKIDSPEGGPPNIGGARNWLYTGLSYTERGDVFSVVKEWKGSGRKGWNGQVYG